MEKFKIEENLFKGDFEGIFLSGDSGITGLFITTDMSFDSGEYETLGGEVKMSMGDTVVRVVEIFS